MYLISGCLLGNNCKYNGGNNHNEAVDVFCRDRSYWVVCPEAMSGLPVPRPPAEYIDGRVMDRDGSDVTAEFQTGSSKALESAEREAARRQERIEGAVLKANSPSCGSGRIYDGSFTGRLVDGYGCFAAMLRNRGIKVISEKEIENGEF